MAAEQTLAEAVAACRDQHDVVLLGRIPRRAAELLMRNVPEAGEWLGLKSISPTPDVARIVSLTAREQVILRELATARGATEIAQRLFVSRNTVKSQLRSLYRKLDVTSAAEAVASARELGLLDRYAPARTTGRPPVGASSADAARRVKEG